MRAMRDMDLHEIETLQAVCRSARDALDAAEPTYGPLTIEQMWSATMARLGTMKREEFHLVVEALALMTKYGLESLRQRDS